jgi:energy-coupling factor transporter ATP-binding protein EcfA2
MYLDELQIENFRSIKRMSLKFDEKVNLLIGPNGAGKTTILESIRLAKAILAPRTQSEMQQTFIQLGASSPHLPQILNFAALLGDLKQPLKIKSIYRLSDDEVSKAAAIKGPISTQILAARHGISLRDFGQQNLVQFMSTSQGQEAYDKITKEMETYLHSLQETKCLRLELEINAQISNIKGMDSISQSMFSAFEASLTPYQAFFSYFPADRALPLGEPPIQLGAADAQQQMESHNAQPNLKYQRMKGTIFSSHIQSEQNKKDIEEQFQLIFSELLTGRGVERYGTNA